MADWATISSMATAGGTLILALATFSSVRSSNRSARVAELSLLTGLRPVLIPSREEDPVERVGFGDRHVLNVPGHGGAVEWSEGNVYLAIALRNGGNGLAVLHGWRVLVEGEVSSATDPRPLLEEFRRQSRDLFIPAGETGFWQGAVRDQRDPLYAKLKETVQRGDRVIVDLLYGDHEGGQRTIARFGITQWEGIQGERAEIMRYWNVDREDPR